MKYASRIVILGATTFGVAGLVAGAPTQATADDLGAQLHMLRAGQAPSSVARCGDMTRLQSLKRSEIQTKLGDPDSCDGVCSDSTKWHYFFSPPAEKGQRGGGFPEVTLTFAPNGVVEVVKCNYAR
jgi:hypothetical protein